MKTLKYFLAITASSLLISAIVPLKTYTVAKDYAVSIHGTSNLHAWDEKVGGVTGTSVVNWNNDGTFDLNSMKIKMEVNSIKSDMGGIMDANTYKALKASAYPDIIFTLGAPVKSISSKVPEKIITAQGNLTIAGVTRFVEMKVKLYIQGQGKLAFEGSKSISMPDYGVEPPVALFGTLKTGKDITINFKINLQ